MRKVKLISAVITGIIVLHCCKQESGLSFGDFDKNRDNAIDQNEFVNVFTSHYTKDWNNRENDYFDDENLYRSVFDIWDRDNDQQFDRSEWEEAYKNYFQDYLINDFDVIDLNRNDYVDFNEFSRVITDSDFFKQWDTDENSYLSKEELANGVFDRWDTDGDGQMSRNEFERLDKYYFDE